MTWTGWEGSTFDLLDPAVSGVMLLEEGIRGLNMPPFTRYTSNAAGIAGARWRGHGTDEREVFWPAFLWSDKGSADWMRADARWWKTMRPDELGVWEVVTAASIRRLRLRFVDDSDHSSPRDPTRLGWCLYGIRMVAEQPYWEGDPITLSWQERAEQPFLPGPPFWVSGTVSLSSAVMQNPGSVDAFPTWVLDGPFSTATVGFAGATITVPFPVAAGNSLTINTSPDEQTAIDAAGVDRTGDLGAASFAPIPSGGGKALTLALAGAGSVSASITPLYYRAWG